MKLTYTKSAFEMPDGKYLAKFLGCTLREDKPGDKPRLGQDGNPLPPAMTWDFEIVSGPEAAPDAAHAGKKTDKLTGRIPTPKSGCGKMLAAIADTILKDGVEVDIAHYAGKFYRVTVQENRVSDNPAPVRVYDHTPATPPVNFPNSPTAGQSDRWDASDGTAVMTGVPTEKLREFLATVPDPSRVRVKVAGAARETAKPATEVPGLVGLKEDGTPATVADEVPW